MKDKRNERNFGNGKTLNAFTIRNLSRETANLANRGDALALKSQSALTDLSQHLEKFGIRYLEAVQPGHLNSWADDLRGRLIAGNISSSTTSSYLSAINTVFATHDRHELKICAREYGLNRCQKFSNRNLANSEASHRAFTSFCIDRYRSTGDVRFMALYHSVSIQNRAGLRFRESTQIKIAEKNLNGNRLQLSKGDGVKNGQARNFKPLDMNGLRQAQKFVQENRNIFTKGSLIPDRMSYRSYKSWAYRTLDQFRSLNQNHRTYHYHGNRHIFAHRQYENKWLERTGIRIYAAVVSGKYGIDHIKEISNRTGLSMAQARAAFKDINLSIAEKLGHHRTDSAFSYTGK